MPQHQQNRPIKQAQMLIFIKIILFKLEQIPMLILNKVSFYRIDLRMKKPRKVKINPRKEILLEVRLRLFRWKIKYHLLLYAKIQFMSFQLISWSQTNQKLT
jgi:hypothetical protein